MKKACLASFLAMSALVFLIAAQPEDKSADFAKKSSELTSSLTARADKVEVIFNFVRDEIAQIKTQYG